MSQIASRRDFYNTTKYSSKIEYEYRINKAIYVGQNVQIVMAENRRRDPAKKKVGQYSVGSNVTVYYNPKKPSDSVLEPGIPLKVYLQLALGLIMLEFSGLLLVYTALIDK